MDAAYVQKLGGPEKIRYGRLPVPVIGPTDVLVAVEAVTVNPVDTFVRSGAFPTPTPFPFLIGRDLAGTVAAVGADVSGFTVGDRVWENNLSSGTPSSSLCRRSMSAAARVTSVTPWCAWRLPQAPG